jgi:hypothetical protein
MLVGSCSWELSGRKTITEDKKVTNSERTWAGKDRLQSWLRFAWLCQPLPFITEH